MLDPQLQAAGIYTDFSGLNALKTEARTHKKAALGEIAKQFEALLLSQMLKSMRQANSVFSEGNYLHSQQGDFYKEMYDHQLALSISQNHGIGLAKVLERQLGSQIQSGNGSHSESPDSSGQSLHTSIRDYPRTLPPMSAQLPGKFAVVTKLLDNNPDSGLGAQVRTERHEGQFAGPADFINQLAPLARKVGAESGIDARLLLAQAALETGWGRHLIRSGAGGNSHNLFGIKADDGWQGNKVSVTTTEYRDGRPLKEVAAFRAYPSYAASFRDYVAFLNANPRYQSVLEKAGNPQAYAQALQTSGYATDPAYGQKIQDILKRDSIQSALDLNRIGLSPTDSEE